MIAAKRNPAIRFFPCFSHSDPSDRANPPLGSKTLLAVVSSLVDRYNKRSRVAGQDRQFCRRTHPFRFP